jgi:hypothetical protein
MTTIYDVDYDDYEDDDDGNDETTAAAVATGDDNEDCLSTDPEKMFLQQWKAPNESPVSHVRAGLKFYDDKIYVQSEGLYFVYCQVKKTREKEKKKKNT